MGMEIRCLGEFAGQRGEGTLYLEGATLLFRGAFRAKIDLTTVTAIAATGGVLAVTTPEGRSRFHLGAKAPLWLDKILNPPSLLKKLGVKADMNVCLVGLHDDALTKDIRAAGAHLTLRPGNESDLILLSVNQKEDLGQLPSLERLLKRTGGIWIVYPKGGKTVTETEVRAAIRSADLVDTKTCSFSPSHTALKVVIPVSRR